MGKAQTARQLAASEALLDTDERFQQAAALDPSVLAGDVPRLEHPDGRWAAFEVKLGYAYADDAARTLLKLAGRVDTSRCGEPAALGVIVPGGLGFRREDRVDVIPLSALRPQPADRP